MVKITICAVYIALDFVVLICAVDETLRGRTLLEILKEPIHLYQTVRKKFNPIGSHILVALFVPCYPVIIVWAILGGITYSIYLLFVLLFGIK